MSRRRHLLTAAAAVAWLSAGAACKGKDNREADPRGNAHEDGGSAVAAAIDAEPAPPDRVEITLDDEHVATIPASELQERRPLDELVAAPRETWFMVEARGPGGRFTSLYKPTDKHPGGRIYVFVDARGVPAFGLFEGDAEQPKVLERRIDHVNVATRRPDRTPPPAPASHFTLAGPGGTPVTATDAMLDDLPEASPPGGDGDGRGWSLRDVVGLIDAGKAATVRVASDGGETTDIPVTQLADPAFIAYMKRNKRGKWRLKTWRARADGSHEQVHSLRDITSIELLE